MASHSGQVFVDCFMSNRTIYFKIGIAVTYKTIKGLLVGFVYGI
jgi:hypothetical protein